MYVNQNNDHSKYCASFDLFCSSVWGNLFPGDSVPLMENSLGVNEVDSKEGAIRGSLYTICRMGTEIPGDGISCHTPFHQTKPQTGNLAVFFIIKGKFIDWNSNVEENSKLTFFVVWYPMEIVALMSESIVAITLCLTRSWASFWTVLYKHK